MDVKVEWCSTGGAAEALSPAPMDAPTPRLGRVTRGKTSSPRPPPPPRGQSPAPKKARGESRLASCKKLRCGTREGADEDHPTCWACDGPPVTGESNRRYWRHFKDTTDVEAAQRLWSVRMAKGDDRGRVIQDREPAMDCFCTKSDCMYAIVKRWREEETEEPTRTCAICSTTKTVKMRKPGMLLGACRVVFSRVDVCRSGEIPLGSTLHAGSDLCNSCYMKAANFSTKRKTSGALLSAHEELELASEWGSPEPDSVDEARQYTRLTFLGRIEAGDFVYLEDAMEVYAKKREEAKLGVMTKKSLRTAVRNMMMELAESLADAEFVTYDPTETGSSDNRTNAQYIMPRAITHRQYAKMHARALQSEKKLAQYEDRARRREHEVTVEGGGLSGDVQERNIVQNG